jgi:hypothetical protein
MVHAANSWINTMETLAVISADSRWKANDIIEWVNTDSGRAMASNMELIKSNARKLRFETRHPDLLAALNAAQTAVGNPGVFDPIWSGSASKVEERAVIYQHLNHVKRVFLDLEEIGIKVLADPPAKGAP